MPTLSSQNIFPRDVENAKNESRNTHTARDFEALSAFVGFFTDHLYLLLLPTNRLHSAEACSSAP